MTKIKNVSDEAVALERFRWMLTAEFGWEIDEFIDLARRFVPPLLDMREQIAGEIEAHGVADNKLRYREAESGLSADDCDEAAWECHASGAFSAFIVAADLVRRGGLA